MTGKRSEFTAPRGLKLADAGVETATKYAYGSMEQAFPDVDPEERPTGSRVLVQMRTPAKMTAGGLALPEEVRETELWNTEVGKVLAMGPLCFKNRDTGESWPEGAWFEVGSFVRCPKYGGSKFEKDVPGTPDMALFAFFMEADIISLLTGDPLRVIAYIK